MMGTAGSSNAVQWPPPPPQLGPEVNNNNNNLTMMLSDDEQHQQVPWVDDNLASESYFITKCESHLAWILAGLSLMVATNVLLLGWILSQVSLEDISIVDAEAIPARIIIPGNVWLSGDLEAGHLQTIDSDQRPLLISAPPGNRIELGPRPKPTDPANLTAQPQQYQQDNIWMLVTPERVVGFTKKVIVRSSLDDHLLLLLQCKPSVNIQHHHHHKQLEPDQPVPCEPNVILGVDSFELLGPNGLNVSNSLQVPLLAGSGPDESLFLHSPTRTINIRAPRGVHIEHVGDAGAKPKNVATTEPVPTTEEQYHRPPEAEFDPLLPPEVVEKRDIQVKAKWNVMLKSKRHKVSLLGWGRGRELLVLGVEANEKI